MSETETLEANHSRRISALEAVVCNLVAASCGVIGTKAAEDLMKQIHDARAPGEPKST